MTSQLIPGAPLLHFVTKLRCLPPLMCDVIYGRPLTRENKMKWGLTLKEMSGIIHFHSGRERESMNQCIRLQKKKSILELIERTRYMQRNKDKLVASIKYRVAYTHTRTHTNVVQHGLYLAWNLTFEFPSFCLINFIKFHFTLLNSQDNSKAKLFKDYLSKNRLEN